MSAGATVSMRVVANPSFGKLVRLRLDQLSPDRDNPRFFPGTGRRFETDDDVFVYIDRKYNAFAIADSIVRHGYFETEPLIALKEPEGHYSVLEGNRRLTALKALASPELRARMGSKRWSRLDSDVQLPDNFPVFVTDSRASVAPVLGFRHVTGNLPWDPFQQALYVADMVDGPEELSTAEVAERISRSASEVRALYRNYSIYEQAETVFQIPDCKRIVDEFGVWNRALSSSGIRLYIRAPAPRDVVDREYPLPEEDGENERLERLLTWLFGLPRSDADIKEGVRSRTGRVISDSRQLTRLGAALSNRESTAVLESGASLDEAIRVTEDPLAQFFDLLAEARSTLEAAREVKPQHVPEKALSDIEAIRGLLDDLSI